jgi:2-methylcitrate dehydratase PrpD
MKMNYTRILANYATNLKFEDLPKEAVEQAKLLTLHVIGVAIAGSQIKQGKDAIALAKEMGGKGNQQY